MLRKDHLVFLDQVAGNHRLCAVSSVGEAFPLNNTANGKAALALLSEDDTRRRLAASFKQGKLKTKNFLNEMRDIRDSGIAEDNQEHTEGICAIGTAFYAVSGLYALSLPLPAVRFEARKAVLKQQLLSTRDNILTALRVAAEK